jgi:hypothetical protein
VCSKRFTQRNHANHSDARARYAVLKERAETSCLEAAWTRGPGAPNVGSTEGRACTAPGVIRKRDRSFKTEQ